METDCEVQSGDEKKFTAEQLAAKQRKRAGLPELELDALPSTIANKMMNLSLFPEQVLTSNKQNKHETQLRRLKG